MTLTGVWDVLFLYWPGGSHIAAWPIDSSVRGISFFRLMQEALHAGRGANACSRISTGQTVSF